MTASLETGSKVFELSKREAGVAVAVDFGYSFGNRVKFLHLTSEPKPFSVGIVARKERVSPAAEKFWQCAKEAAVSKREMKSVR